MLPELTDENLLRVQPAELNKWFEAAGWDRRYGYAGHYDWILPHVHWGDPAAYGILIPRKDESASEHIRLVRNALYHLVTHTTLLDGAMRTILASLLQE